MDKNLDTLEMEFETSLWAKKSEKSGLFKWLPLKQHLVDTMNISGLLWEHWMSKGQKQLVLSSMGLFDDEDAKRLVQFLGGIHDIGKATPVFQARRTQWNSLDLDIQLIQKLRICGFDLVDLLDFPSPHKSHHSIASQALLSSYGVNEGICALVGGHHGKPVDSKLEIISQLDSYAENYFQIEDQSALVHKKWDQTQRSILNWIMKETGYSYIGELPEIDITTSVLLSGLLIMADWIASNEDYFPLIHIDDDGEGIDQIIRLKHGWYKWTKSSPWEASPNNCVDSYYKNRFNFDPNEIQYKLSIAVEESVKPGIFILEAPMGIGKTEAALVAVEQLARKTGRSGLFFGLPTQATSDGIFPRIQRWLEHIPLEDTERKSLQLVHGKSALNPDFSSLASNIDIDSDNNSSVIVNEWFTGRKTAILDDFVVGTVDHFLLSALKQKHLALRHLGLSKKVIVIDEVHAYDAYMSQYLNRAIHWMGTYGVPVIILSATLPAARRKEIVESYSRGVGYKIRDLKVEDGWDTTNSYPLITYLDAGEIKTISEFKLKTDKVVRVEKLDDAELLSIVEDSLYQGGVVGIIVNTVKKSQRLAKMFAENFGQDLVELLHSSFISTHRIQKEKELLNSIGKGASRPYKKIIIGTQVIEQSLDIDFDLLISDIAPMDLLLQRVGRLHRHELVHRPDNVLQPKLYVLGINEEFIYENGTAYVYDEYFLMRTQYFLPGSLYLPDDISNLVQRVYDESNIEFLGEIKEQYLSAKEKMESKLHFKKEKAKSYLLDKPRKKSSFQETSLIGWLSNTAPYSSDERGFAQVRDSTDSVEVIVLRQSGDGYSLIDQTEDLSDKIQQPEFAKMVAQQTIKLPNILSASYNIDKTIDCLEKETTRRLPNWQNQSWLKGALAIIFNENNECELNGWRLHYNKKYGLEYERIASNGAI